MIKGFLFDLDGVIVETAIFHYQAWRRMANELGFDISEEFNEKLKGISRTESLEIILMHGGVELSEEKKVELATKKNEWYLELVSQMTEKDILEGIPEFFEQIKQTDIKIGLGSVSKNAKMILERVGLIDQFDIIIDGTKITKGKPDPEVFLKGAEELRFRTNECLVFEDAVAGIQAAKNAGMKAVGIGKPEILTQADVVYPNLEGVKIEEILNTI
ncbi:MAG: beta-phosphoglucomutase [Spirosomaceae bacterium]|jgi:beta-phosphoglucomutase|nr:beta-phosphoglucomutase [Spirosomataceae bacterium]